MKFKMANHLKLGLKIQLCKQFWNNLASFKEKQKCTFPKGEKSFVIDYICVYDSIYIKV